MQYIGVHGESEKLVVTLLVIRGFSDLPGAPRDCVAFRGPTEVSRIIIAISSMVHLLSSIPIFRQRSLYFK